MMRLQHLAFASSRSSEGPAASGTRRVLTADTLPVPEEPAGIALRGMRVCYCVLCRPDQGGPAMGAMFAGKCSLEGILKHTRERLA